MAVADSPLGPFKQAEKRWLYEEKAIDGHLFLDEDGTVYLYYVRLDAGNRIFVAKMAEDLKSIDTLYEHCLIQAEEPWETVDCLVAEGPFVLKHKGLYYLTYSCNHTRCHSDSHTFYCTHKAFLCHKNSSFSKISEKTCNNSICILK